MKLLITAAVVAMGLFAGQAYSASAACEKSADDKKLSGAARTSHIKKCEQDAAAGAAGSPACEKSAADKKLSGAAKTSHIKKCTADEKAAAAKK
jgi:hypothetical protein